MSESMLADQISSQSQWEHLVGGSESLASIAIRYDTTPGELAQLNKLSSRVVFPGQKLKVPSPESLAEIDTSKKPQPSPSLPIVHSQPVRFCSQFSSYENISLPRNIGNENLYSSSLPRASPGDEVTETIIKIRAKHITHSKGCVHGKIHLSPQSFIFEPDPTDKLVELQGEGEFAVILSMQSIVDLTVTSDITKMFTKAQVSSPRGIPAKSPGLARKTPAKEPAKDSPKEIGNFEAPIDFEFTDFLANSHTKNSPEMNTAESNTEPEKVSTDSEDMLHPMFLRLSTLQTPLDTFDTPPASLFARLTRSRADIDTPQKRVKSRSEFWFAIPNSRSDTIYAFLIMWNPGIHKCGSPTPPQETEHIQDGSYTLLFKENHIDQEPIDIPSSSWDIFPSLDTIREMDHRAATDAVPLPNLVGTASLLSQSLLRELNYLLPSRTVGHDLWLVYSSFVHGISLRTMYRNMEQCNSPVVFVLRDEHQEVFGGVVSCPLRVSEHYYGTGESFMFRLDRTKQKVLPYRWTGINTFFVKGDHDSISFGGGNGKPALWLDGDFYNGSSFPCKTFDNKCLSSSEDFLCTGFESWGFAGWRS